MKPGESNRVPTMKKDANGNYVHGTLHPVKLTETFTLKELVEKIYVIKKRMPRQCFGNTSPRSDDGSNFSMEAIEDQAGFTDWLQQLQKKQIQEPFLMRVVLHRKSPGSGGSGRPDTPAADGEKYWPKTRLLWLNDDENLDLLDYTVPRRNMAKMMEGDDSMSDIEGGIITGDEEQDE